MISSCSRILRIVNGVTLFLAGLLFASCSVFSGSKTVSPNCSDIKYFGRWDTSDSASYKSYWGGNYFKVNFTGAHIRIIIGLSSNFYVNIDGVKKIYNKTQGTINLTSSPLSNGEHTLEVATVDVDDIMNFKGLIIDSNASTQAPEVKNKIIEFIGASVITGYGQKGGCTDSYAWLTAENLGCEHTQIAEAGLNLVNNWSGGSYIETKIGLEKVFLKLQNADYPYSPDWNFSRYSADAVVINIGGNDMDFNVPEPTFQKTFVELIKSIRSKYSKAKIFALRSFYGAYENQMKVAVKKINDSGDSNVYYIDTTGWLNDEDFDEKIDYHPTLAGHKKVADKLTEFISSHKI